MILLNTLWRILELALAPEDVLPQALGVRLRLAVQLDEVGVRDKLAEAAGRTEDFVST